LALFILASVLILVDITRIVNGIFDKHQSLLLPILKIVLGVLMLPLSIVVLAYPGLGRQITLQYHAIIKYETFIGKKLYLVSLIKQNLLFIKAYKFLNIKFDDLNVCNR